jgi:hypothetical protein
MFKVNIQTRNRMLFFVLFSPIVLQAQVFTYVAKIKPVVKDSLYKISLEPEFSKYMMGDYRDVRLFDSKLNLIPYTIISEPVIKSKNDFVSYEVKSLKHFKTYSEVIIHNKDKHKINNIAFNINNSDAYKYCSVEGSDDMKQWYSVSALQELKLLYNDNYTNQYKCIYFPLNNYKYFRLLMDDWYSNPLKVNEAGYFKNTVMAGELNKIPFIYTIKHHKLKKTTTIDIKFDNSPILNQLEFIISSPRLFKRTATLFVTKEKREKKKKKLVEIPIKTFEISSDNKNLIDLSSISENQLIIEIKNQDNPPLQIDSLFCKQLATYLIADLKSKETYRLKFGDTKLSKPIYDIDYFVNGVPQLYPSTELDSLIKIDNQTTQTSGINEVSFFEKPLFMWLSLALGALVTSLFAYSLIKDMKKKNQ